MIEVAAKDRRYVIIPEEDGCLLVEAICVQYNDPDVTANRFVSGHVQKPWMIVTHYESRELLLATLKGLGLPPPVPIEASDHGMPVATYSAKELPEMWENFERDS
jgi:hypothetical protein